MKKKKKFLKSALVALLVGITLVVISWLIISGNTSFLSGFLTGGLILALGILLFKLISNGGTLNLFSNKNQPNKDLSRQTIILPYILGLFLFLTILISIGIGFLINKQNEQIQAQTDFQNRALEQQLELIDQTRRGNLVFLVSNILDKVDGELENNPDRTISDATIARIAALSLALKPYRYPNRDSLSSKQFSVERGQLLLALLKMNMDSNSLDKIKFNTTFAGADLERADLRGADLRKINLRDANLKEANLRKADLSQADIRGVYAWGADLQEANFKKTDLREADFRWANLNSCDMRKANLNGANFTCAQLKKVDVRGGSAKWTYMNIALLNEANFAGVNVIGTEMERANLSGADFSNTNLRRTTLIEAIMTKTNLSGSDMGAAEMHYADLEEAYMKGTDLYRATVEGANFSGAYMAEALLRKTTIWTGADLTGVTLDKAVLEEDNLFEKLKNYDVKGTKDIELKYKIVPDTMGRFPFYLEKK